MMGLNLFQENLLSKYYPQHKELIELYGGKVIHLYNNIVRLFKNLDSNTNKNALSVLTGLKGSIFEIQKDIQWLFSKGDDLINCLPEDFTHGEEDNEDYFLGKDYDLSSIAEHSTEFYEKYDLTSNIKGGILFIEVLFNLHILRKCLEKEVLNEKRRQILYIKDLNIFILTIHRDTEKFKNILEMNWKHNRVRSQH